MKHPDWTDRYRELAAALPGVAARRGPQLLGFNACVDAVWRVGPELLERLTGLARPDRPTPAGDEAVGAGLLREVLARITAGRGGELPVDWPAGPAWLGARLPAPDRRQLGGTGPQAAWTLAELGACTVVALADRSAAQLSVLHPEIRIADRSGPVPVRAATPDPGGLTRPMHHILEFAAGTRHPGGVLPRSTRIILRFAADGIERDERLVDALPGLLPTLRGAVLSGMNGIADADRSSWAWLDRMVDAWTAAAVPDVHLELADYAGAAALHRAAAHFAGRVHTMGLSLSELRVLSNRPDPGAAARELAGEHGYRAVVVHADTWSLAAHRGDPDEYRGRLLTGNLLAAARAAAGRPQRRVELPPDAELSDDLPPAGPAGAGWTVTCAPAPWLRCPRSTIGLGDSFVAGFQLGTTIRGPTRAGT